MERSGVMTVDQEQRNTRTTIRLKGQAFADKVKELIHEGNVRRIVIKNESNHTVMEIPVTAGVVAAVIAPIVTAVGAIAALANEWSIEVEHREEPPTDEVTVVEEK
jgi:putative cell wall-binding protein